ncbi:unnamed protein product [Cochlearia groenlandica]
MCSKTRSGNHHGDNNNDDDYISLCPKKHKHNNNNNNNNVSSRRVPRRGPGVAELEKIRLEEQQQQQQHHNSSSASSLSSPPVQEKSPTNYVERTGPVYPFSPFFLTGSFPDDLIPPVPVFHRNHDSSLHYLPPMNLPNRGSDGFYQFIESPSNQKSCIDNVTQFLDDEKILTRKRPWHVMSETTKCNVGPTIGISRDGKQIKSLDQRLKNHFQDSGTTIRNPINIDSPSLATPPPPIPIIPSPSLDLSRFIQYEQKQGFNNETIPRKSSANVSSNRKPFYSFLPANEQSIRDQDLSFSLRTERYDNATDHHGIDLRLKL